MDNIEKMVSQYKMVFDYHTHTVYSHGKGTIEENVREAHDKGIKKIAITDHGPGHLTYGLKLSELGKMRADIEDAKKKYPDVEVLLGVEANTLRVEPFLDITPEEAKSFDILLAGYHFGILHAGMIPNYMNAHAGLFGGDNSTLKVKNTAMILDALYYWKEQGRPIDVLTHPGDKGPFDVEDIARACADTGTLIEINDKHKHLTTEEIKIASAFDVKFIIGSDAHISSKVGSFEAPLMRAFEAGLEPERIVNIEKR